MIEFDELPLPANLKRRILRFTSVSPAGCIIWSGASVRGYAYMTIGGKVRRLHRVIAAYRYGQLAPKMVVSHSCDNPSCINPAHLRVETQKENIQDCIRKSRRTQNSDSARAKRVLGSAKINVTQVREIRSLYASGTKARPLSVKFGISIRAVRDIVNNISWRLVA